jgi:hypothetical protein
MEMSPARWDRGSGEGSLRCRPAPPDGQRLQRRRKRKWAPYTHYSPHGGDAAEGFLPVVMSTRAAPAQAIATHGVVDIAALVVTPTKRTGGGDMWVGASHAKSEVASVDEVPFGDAEIN